MGDPHTCSLAPWVLGGRDMVGGVSVCVWGLFSPVVLGKVWASQVRKR